MYLRCRKNGTTRRSLILFASGALGHLTVETVRGQTRQSQILLKHLSFVKSKTEAPTEDGKRTSVALSNSLDGRHDKTRAACNSSSSPLFSVPRYVSDRSTSWFEGG